MLLNSRQANYRKNYLPVYRITKSHKFIERISVPCISRQLQAIWNGVLIFSQVIISICSIIPFCFKATPLKTGVLKRTGRDLFYRASRPAPCCHALYERRALPSSQTGILFCVCSWVQNNTLPLSCFMRFMMHLSFCCTIYILKWWPEWESNPHAFAQRSELCVYACFTIRPLSI